MTAERLAKMRAGREAAERRRMIAEDMIAAQFVEWLRLDARTAMALREARHDGTEAEYIAAYDAWRDVQSLHPGIPTDAAMRRIRGES